MLGLEKSLVYFSTSLKGNELVLEKLMRTQFVKAYPEDEELLEDVIIENKQAIEMSNIYRDILSGTMDAFASVISNNLNIVMKVLASVTIILTIPPIIFGLWGSNVPVPFETSPYGFWIVIAIAVLFTGAAVVWMLKKKWLWIWPGRAGNCISARLCFCFASVFVPFAVAEALFFLRLLRENGKF